MLQLLQWKACKPTLFERLWPLRQKSSIDHISDDFTSPLCSVLETALGAEREVVLVIDGLDELDNPETQGPSLMSSIHRISNASQDAGNSFKCILTSRNPRFLLPNIWTERRIVANDNMKDLEATLQTSLEHVSSFTQLQSDQRKELLGAILSKSQGMFLWANLTLGQISKAKSYIQMCGVLHNSPRGLEAYYDSLLKKVDTEDEDVKRIFQWLLVVRQPLSVKDLETVLSIEYEEDEPVIRSATLEDVIREKCGPLIRIESGEVGFSHVSVRQFLSSLDPTNRASWMIPKSHFEVAVRSLKYLSLPLEALPAGMPLQVRANDNIDLLYREVLDKHPLAKYAAQMWFYHLMESGRVSIVESTVNIPQEVTQVFPTYQAIAWIEQLSPITNLALSEAIKAYDLALGVREFLLGDSHLETMQTIVNLARLYEERSNPLEAIRLYKQAWEHCKSDLAHKEEAAFDCAERIMKTVEVAGLGEDAIGVCAWMWRTRKRVLGEADALTISTGERLAWILLRHQRIKDSVTVEREVWESCISSHGHCDSRSLRAASTLAKSYSLYDANDARLNVYQTIWSATEVEGQDEETFVTILSNYVESLRVCGKHEVAEKELDKLMTKLSGAEASLQDLSKRLRVIIERAKLEKRRAIEHAKSFLLENWKVCLTLLPKEPLCRRELYRPLRDLAHALLELKEFLVAQDIYSIILAFQSELSGSDSLEAVRASVDLAKAYKQGRQRDLEKVVLQSTAEACLATQRLNAASMGACSRLAYFYQSVRDWEAAEKVWMDWLKRFWPQFLTDLESGPPLPDQESAIEFAWRLAFSQRKRDEFSAARLTYERLFKICKSADAPETLAVLKQYASFLIFRGEPGTVEELYNEYFNHLKQRYGGLDYRLVAAAKEAAFVYETIIHNLEKAEAMYKIVQRVTSHHLGEWNNASIEASLALVRLSKKQKKQRLSAIQLEKLWAGLSKESEISLSKGHNFQISESTFQMLYEKLLMVYYKADWLGRDAKIAALDTQYTTIEARHFRGYGATLDRAFVLARSLERDGRTEDAIAQYERFLKCRMNTEDNVPPVRIQDADSSLATDPYVKFHAKLEAFEIYEKKNNPSKKAGITSAGLTEAILRLCKLYIVQGSQSSLLKGFKLIQRERKNLETALPEFLDLMNLLGIIAASVEKIESLRLEWDAAEAQRRGLRDIKWTNVPKTFLGLTKALCSAYHRNGDLSVLRTMWNCSKAEGHEIREAVESDLIALLRTRHAASSDPSELRQFWEVLAKDSQDSESCDVLEASLQSIYWNEASSNGDMQTYQDFWESVVEKRGYHSKSLDTMEAAMISACIKEDSSNDGVNALRVLWDTTRKIRPKSKAFLSMTKTLGSHYASTDQVREFHIICRGLDGAPERRLSSSESSEFGDERTETLSDLYQQIGLKLSLQLDVNKALRIIDWTLLAKIRAAESVWTEDNKDRFLELIKPCVQGLRDQVETDELFLNFVGRQDLENFLLKEAYMRVLDIVNSAEEYGHSHPGRIAVENHIARLHLRTGDIDKAMELLSGLAETLMNPDQISSRLLFLIGFEVTESLYGRSHLPRDVCIPLPISFGVHENMAKDLQRRLLTLLFATRNLLPVGHSSMWKFQHSYENLLLHDHDEEKLLALFEQFWADRLSSWTDEETRKLGIKLANLHLKQGRASPAEFVADEVVRHVSSTDGPTSSECIEASNALSFIYTAQGCYEKSLDIHSKILDRLQSRSRSSSTAFQGGFHGKFYYTQLNLKGRALERLGQWQEAEKCYDQLEAEIHRSWGHDLDIIKRKLGNILEWKSQSRFRRVGRPVVEEGHRERGIWETRSPRPSGIYLTPRNSYWGSRYSVERSESEVYLYSSESFRHEYPSINQHRHPTLVEDLGRLKREWNTALGHS